MPSPPGYKEFHEGFGMPDLKDTKGIFAKRRELVTAGPSAAARALVRSQVGVGERWEATVLGRVRKRCSW